MKTITHLLRHLALTAVAALALATPAVHADSIAFATSGAGTTPMSS